MFTREELIERLQPFTSKLQHRNTVAALYLFGSYASGRQTPLSDIDLAVLFDVCVEKEAFLPERLKLLGKLSSILSTDAVELVVLNEAPPALGYRVTRDGVLLYASDNAGSQIINFKVKTWDRYFDYQPTQRIFSDGLARRIQEGRYGG